MRYTKYALVAAVAIIFFVSACATTPETVDRRTSAAGIANPSAGAVSLERSDYEILGSVSGSGSVTLNMSSLTISGDTERYGYVGDLPGFGPAVRIQERPPGLIERLLGVRLGPTTQAEATTRRPAGVNAIARSNAAYEMVMEAREMDADAVIFVTVTEQITTVGNDVTHNIEMTGRAIRIVSE